MMSISHRIRVATKAFMPRRMPESGRIRASISKRTSMRFQFARGCQRNGRGVLMVTLAEIAQKKSFKHLELNDCSFTFAWRYPKFDIKDIIIEERGKFRIEGEISIDHRGLGGTIRLGLTRAYLDWLPNPEEVFSRHQGGYLWTNIHLSGTIDDPRQDLSSRIIELFKESPGAYLGVLFRQFEGWLKKVFGGD